METTILHSQSKENYNVVNKSLGGKYKIARVPYLTIGHDIMDKAAKEEAYRHAIFISEAFNSAKKT